MDEDLIPEAAADEAERADRSRVAEARTGPQPEPGARPQVPGEAMPTDAPTRADILIWFG